MPKLPASVLKRRKAEREAKRKAEETYGSKKERNIDKLRRKKAERDAAKGDNPDSPSPLNFTPGAMQQRLANRRAASAGKPKPKPEPAVRTAQREKVSPRTESLTVTPEQSKARTDKISAEQKALQSKRSMIAEPETPPSLPKKKPRVTGKGTGMADRNVGKKGSGNEKANVTREQLAATGVNLTDYLNKYDELKRRPTKADFGPAKKMRGGGMMKTKGYMAGGKMKTKGYKAGGKVKPKGRKNTSKVRGAGIARKGVRPAKMR